MKKFSITMVSLVTMAGFALAQPKADPKAGSGAAAGAGATVKAGAGAGSAAAGAKVDAKAGAAAQVKMEMPKPPAEHAALLKQMGTRMNCTGVSWGGMDGKTEMKTTMKGTMALALDGWHLKSASTITMGEGKAKMTLKGESYMTWDAKAAKWRTIGAMNDGSVSIGTMDMKDGKMESSADTYGGMMGNGKFRERGDMTDPKNVKMSGEMSMDGGKTWNKVYDITCKK
jgi:hypothetical protein